MATAYDNYVMTQIVTPLLAETGDQDVLLYGKEIAKKAYENTQAINQEAFEKQEHDKKYFFEALVSEAITENFIEQMIENQIKQERSEEIALLVQLQDSKLASLAREEQLLSFKEYLDEKYQQKIPSVPVLENNLNQIIKQIDKIDAVIANSIKNWGGETWERGQSKLASNQALEFRKNAMADLPGGIDYSTLPAEKKQIVDKAIDASASLYEERLAAIVSPTKVIEKLSDSYKFAQAVNQDIPNAPVAPPPPTFAMPTRAQAIDKVVLHNELFHHIAVKDLYNSLKQTFGDAMSKLNIKDITNYVKKHNNLDQLKKTMTDFLKIPDLKNQKLELQAIGKSLKDTIGAIKDSANQARHNFKF